MKFSSRLINKLSEKWQFSNRNAVFCTLQTRLFAVLSLLFLTAAFSLNASAQTVVTPSNTQGWANSDTRPGGAVNFIFDSTTPSGFGALQLTTDNTTTAKADYFRYIVGSTPYLNLASVTELGYYTKKVSAPFNGADPAYQIPVCLNGFDGTNCGPDLAPSPAASSFSTLVFEPYLNGTVTNNVWQQWDVDQGSFYSTRTIQCSNGTLTGSQGSSLYTLSQITTACPNTIVLGYGVNIGSNNPSYNVETDLFNFNGTVFDFEPASNTIAVDDDGMASATDCDATDVASTTIQAAVTAANPGDTIKVCPGNYPESLSINKTLTLLGAQSGVNAGTGTRTGLPATESVISSNNVGKTPLYLTANNVTIDGFTIQGNTNVNQFGTGILVQSTRTGSQILNNIVQNNIIGIIPASGTTIRGNLIRNNNNSGPAGGSGIYQDVGNDLANLVIDNNTFSGNNNAGVVISRAGKLTTSVTVSNNTFSGNGSGLALTGVSNATITGNTITNSAGSQIFLNGVSNLNINCNAIVNGLARGVRVANSGNTNIALNNNNIHDNAGIGLDVPAGSYTGTLNAENNYWGTPNGPTIASNPGGSGEEINDPDGVVDYTPFSTAPTSCAPDITRPSLTITPSGGTVNGTPTTFTFTFSEPVTDFTIGDIIVTNGTKSNFTTVNSSTYTVDVTPTSNGPITVSVPENVAFDMAGNGNTAASSTVNVRCNNVSIATGTTTPTNTQFTVPINVDDTTGQGILSYDFTLNYDPSVITFVSASTTGTLSSGWTITTNNSGGTLVVSGFNTAPLSGAGVLLNLNFIATGGINSTSGLNFSAFQFNEGIPCVNTTNGDITVISGTISGTVTYANAQSGTVPVPNTTIDAAGSIPLSTMTDSNGMYSLSGFGPGAYTITPSKSNQVNGISNLDASRVAQHIVGFITLNSTQQIAADVSGNGTITSLDAAYIAQFVAGIPNPSFTGTWRFLPPNRSYPNVQTSYTAQDYSAILLGEVTGNWNPSGPLRPNSSEKTLASDSVAQPEQVVTVSAPPAQGVNNGDDFTVALTASNTTGEGILGYEFVLTYDSSVILPQLSPCDNVGTLSSSLSVTCNPTVPGTLRVVLFGTMPISGAGTLLKLNFNAVGTSGTMSPLTFQSFMFNEGAPLDVTTDGQVLVLAPTAAGVSIEGQVLTADMRGLSDARVTLTNGNGESRTVKTNSFGYYRFDDVPAGQNYTLEAKSRRYNFMPLVLPVGDNLAGINIIAVQ